MEESEHINEHTQEQTKNISTVYNRGISLDTQRPKPYPLIPLDIISIKSSNTNSFPMDIQSHMSLEHNFQNTDTCHSFSPNRYPPNNDYLLPPLNHSSNKKTLVLDLDETLIHSSYYKTKPNSEYADYILKVSIT
jgi:TFIIF-interacting CTD phosphatase-like protein